MTKEIQLQDFDPAPAMQVMMMLIVMMALVAIIPASLSAQSYYESQQYEGQTDPRTLHVTHAAQHIGLPNPWIGAYFINDGPASVEIRINDSDDPPFVINPGETITINRAGARDRIYAIHYVCYIGGTATLRIIGEY